MAEIKIERRGIVTLCHYVAIYLCYIVGVAAVQVRLSVIRGCEAVLVLRGRGAVPAGGAPRPRSHLQDGRGRCSFFPTPNSSHLLHQNFQFNVTLKCTTYMMEALTTYY